jgi:hypothetical protein
LPAWPTFPCCARITTTWSTKAVGQSIKRRRGSCASGADTNLPLWDETRPDFDWAVPALVSEAGGERGLGGARREAA